MIREKWCRGSRLKARCPSAPACPERAQRVEWIDLRESSHMVTRIPYHTLKITEVIGLESLRYRRNDNRGVRTLDMRFSFPQDTVSFSMRMIHINDFRYSGAISTRENRVALRLNPASWRPGDGDSLYASFRCADMRVRRYDGDKRSDGGTSSRAGDEGDDHAG